MAGMNVLNPEGELVSLPSEQVSEALKNGYSEATQQDVDAYIKNQKYGGVGQGAISALEGAGEAGTFGASTAIERSLSRLGVPGLTPEDIRSRREAHPIAHGVGQIGGLLGTSALGIGEGALLERAGQGAAGLLGIGAPVSAAAKIGSAAVKGAVETGLFQGGDEASKLFSGDPDQSLQTAISDIGLATALGGGLGGALGTVSPLWNATVGPKVGSVLKAISDRAGGIEAKLPDVMNDAIQTSGMNLAPEVRAALADDPFIRQAFQTLQESPTASGLKAQEALQNFKGDVSKRIVQALGKTPEEIERLPELSEFEAGEKLKKTMAADIKGAIDPLSERFEGLKERFSQTPLLSERLNQIGDQVSQLAFDKGYNLTTLSGESGIVNQVLKELPNLKNITDLTKYQSALNNVAKGKPELFDVVRSVRNILRNAESDIIGEKIAQTNPELLDVFAKARSAYQENMGFIDSLNDRLHVGRYHGPGSFIKNLEEMKPEDVLRRMQGKNDAELIQKYLLPDWEKQLQDFHLNKSLKGAAERAGPSEIINSKAFFKSLEKMSPELKQFAVGRSAKELGAIQKLIESIPEKMNTSGTAKTLDALWGYVPASATGMVTMLLSHNPALAFLTGALTKWAGRDLPDAGRLAMLKFLGSGQSINAPAFKSIVDFSHHLIRAESTMNKSVKALFKSGSSFVIEKIVPSEKIVKNLDKKLEDFQTDENALMNIGGELGHYMPEHATSLAKTGATAVSYLNSLRPREDKQSPLDNPLKPTKAQVATFHRALEIAEQPLTVLKHINDNTLTSRDVLVLNTIYPGVYARISQKIMNEIIETENRGESIPYDRRLQLSLFLGQPLDSTMTGQSILAHQNMDQPSPPIGPMKQPPHSMTALNKLPSLYQTSAQSRELQRRK